MNKEMTQRINHIIGSVKRIPNWVQLSRSLNPSQQRGGYNGLKSESFLLMKESFRLWWYLIWHRVKIRDGTPVEEEAASIVEKAFSKEDNPDYRRSMVNMAGWKRTGTIKKDGVAWEIWRKGALKRQRNPQTHEVEDL